MSADADPGEAAATSVLVLASDAQADPPYARSLEQRYPTAVAAGGRPRLDRLEGPGVVVHDRDRAAMSGQELLRAARDRRPHWRLVTTTSTPSNTDHHERGFDEVLSEPPSTAEVLAAVERQLSHAGYVQGVGRLFELCERRAAYVERRPDRPEPRLATASLDRVIRFWKRRTERHAETFEPAEAADRFAEL